MEEKDKIVMIKVTSGTREKLKTLGIKGESYDIIVQRLMRGWIENEKKIQLSSDRERRR